MRTLPGNIARVVILGTLATGIIFNGLMISECEFIKSKTLTDFDIPIGGNDLNIEDGVLKMGLFDFGVEGRIADQDNPLFFDQCLSWPDEFVDNQRSLRVARIVGTMALGGGALAFLLLMIDQFAYFEVPCGRCLTSIAFMVAYVLAGVVYIIYNIDICNRITCKWGKGATWNVIAWGCYFFSSLFSCCLPRGNRFNKPDEDAEDDYEKGGGGEEETEEEHKIGEDGGEDGAPSGEKDTTGTTSTSIFPDIDHCCL